MLRPGSPPVSSQAPAFRFLFQGVRIPGVRPGYPALLTGSGAALHLLAGVAVRGRRGNSPRSQRQAWRAISGILPPKPARSGDQTGSVYGLPFNPFPGRRGSAPAASASRSPALRQEASITGAAPVAATRLAHR